MRRTLMFLLLLLVPMSRAQAAPLTADEAVKIALQRNTQVVQSKASLLDAKSRMWSAYSSVLPSVSGSWSVTNTWSRAEAPTSSLVADSAVPPALHDVVSRVNWRESNTYTPSLSARWNVLDLSSLTAYQAARNSSRASKLSNQSTRNDVALEALRRFYLVVQDEHLADVSAGALRRARDDERRVRALFEVGSVSKSDLLKARVATSQSELDSLLADHAVITARIALAEWLGVKEQDLAAVDTVLSVGSSTYGYDEVLTDARRKRPDIASAEASVRAAELTMRSAHLSRLPYLSATAGASIRPHGHRKVNGTIVSYDGVPYDPTVYTTTDLSTSGSPLSYNTTLSLNMDIFDGFATDSRVASARAGLVRARETRDALVRTLESDVRQALLGYQEALERAALARRTLESASENHNLVQQKYNVGSATILDLIDSQVQLQQAQSSLVSATVAIRIAEAQIDQVRGRPQ